MEKYKVPVVRILAYNSQANGKIERTHWTYMDSIWKVCEGKTSDWLSWLNYTLWANRIMTKNNMGYSPYYLLYDQHPVLPFEVEDKTFHVLDWPGVVDTVDLLVLRMKQLVQLSRTVHSHRAQTSHTFAHRPFRDCD